MFLVCVCLPPRPQNKINSYYAPQAFARTTHGEPAERPPALEPEFDEALDQLERAASVEAAMAARTAQLQAAEREVAGALRRTESLVVDLLEAKRHILLLENQLEKRRLSDSDGLLAAAQWPLRSSGLGPLGGGGGGGGSTARSPGPRFSHPPLGHLPPLHAARTARPGRPEWRD